MFTHAAYVHVYTAARGNRAVELEAARERGARGVHGGVGPVRCFSLTRLSWLVCRSHASIARPGAHLRGVFELYRDRTVYTGLTFDDEGCVC